MDSQYLGKMISGVAGVFELLIGIILVLLLVIFLLIVGYFVVPTEADKVKEKERQAVIETLTPEQKKALDL